MLTSHELGFYKTFCLEKPNKIVKKIASTKNIIIDRDYVYLYLKKMSFRGKVAISQKDIAKSLGVTVQTIRRGQQRLEKAGLLERLEEPDPISKKPIMFKIKTP